MQKVYRNMGSVPQSLSPVPRWELIRDKDYMFKATLCIGKGCPWRCEFCYNNCAEIDHTYRGKSFAQIEAEIASTKSRHVMFIDDNFIGDIKQARELVKLLRRKNLIWHTAVSADIGYHPDLIKAMAESGCRSLFIGFESINQPSLRECAKVQNLTQHFDRTIAHIHGAGMLVNASLAFGFDSDEPTIFSNTLQWLLRNKVATMTAHILTPYPGTSFYARLLQEGRIVEHDLSYYDTSFAVFEPKQMSRTQLQMGYRRIYEEFYSLENIMKRLPSQRSQWLAFLQFNFFIENMGILLSYLLKERDGGD